jgi:hypothetical protein
VPQAVPVVAASEPPGMARDLRARLGRGRAGVAASRWSWRRVASTTVIATHVHATTRAAAALATHVR